MNWEKQLNLITNPRELIVGCVYRITLRNDIYYVLVKGKYDTEWRGDYYMNTDLTSKVVHNHNLSYNTNITATLLK